MYFMYNDTKRTMKDIIESYFTNNNDEIEVELNNILSSFLKRTF